MHRRLSTAVAAALLACGLTAGAAAQQKTEVIVQYSQPQIFDPGFVKLKEVFEAQNPDVRITYRGPQANYDTGIQAMLRESLTGDMPHVNYIGLNHLRVVYDRDLAVDLAKLMKAEGGSFEAQGWTESLQGLGRIEGRQIALPFAVSMPVVYYNAELVKRAGGDPDALPRDWDGLLKLAGRIKALEPDMAGLYHTWTGASGPWLFQGLVYGKGGDIMKVGAKTVAFGGEEGRYAIELYRRMVDEGGMPNITDQAARQQFIAGKMGLFLDSISRLSNFETSIGDRFDLRTGYFPLPDGKTGGLVTGGAASIVTKAAEKDPKVLHAAWRWVKFTSGPRGTTEVIKHVGYTPVNVLALKDPALLQGYFDDRPRHKTAIDQLGNLREWYQFPGQNGVKINDAMIEYLQAVVDKSMKPEAALAAMVRETDRLLPR